MVITPRPVQDIRRVLRIAVIRVTFLLNQVEAWPHDESKFIDLEQPLHLVSSWPSLAGGRRGGPCEAGFANQKLFTGGNTTTRSPLALAYRDKCFLGYMAEDFVWAETQAESVFTCFT